MGQPTVVAVSALAAGAASSGAVAIPAHQAKDRVYLVVETKLAAGVTPTLSTSGWTVRGINIVGGTGSGVDSGTTRVDTWARTVGAGETVASVTVTLAAGVLVAAFAIVLRPAAGEDISDATEGIAGVGAPVTAWAGSTIQAQIDSKVDDLLIAIAMTNTDAPSAVPTRTLSDFATAHSVGAFTTVLNTGSTGGTDLEVDAFSAYVTAGTGNASWAAGWTWNAACGGSRLLVRVRSESAAQTGAATLTQTSALSAAPQRFTEAAATLSAGSTLSASPVATRPAAATLSASSVLSAGGTRVVLPSAALVQDSVLVAGGTRVVLPTAALVQNSTLSATATQQGTQSASATLSQSSTLSASGSVTQFGAANLVQNSVLGGSGTRTAFAAVTLTAPSTLSASGTRVQIAAATLSQTSTMSAGGAITRFGSAALVQTSVLSATGQQTGLQLASATLTQTSTLSASAVRGTSAAVTMVQTSVMGGVASVTRFAGVTMVQATMINSIGLITKEADAALSQDSTISVDSTRLTEAGVTLVQDFMMFAEPFSRFIDLRLTVGVPYTEWIADIVTKWDAKVVTTWGAGPAQTKEHA